MLAVSLIIAVVAMVQSLFGVGVLLFGTPSLLLLGYDFVGALLVLLPISVTINFLQIARNYRQIDLSFYKKILTFTIPTIVIFLFLVTYFKVNIAIVVGVFLIFVALKNVIAQVDQLLGTLVQYERSYLIVMGMIHGLTNLGGSLLTAIIHTKNYPRDEARVTTAAAYCTFACFQIATLLLAHNIDNFPYQQNLFYLLIGVTVFAVTEKLLYKNIDNAHYRLIFAFFLAASGLMLICKTLFLR